ncbi:MAG: hypothetical protein QXR45_16550 [Candidatus Bathyarchaeia archaeon]
MTTSQYNDKLPKRQADKLERLAVETVDLIPKETERQLHLQRRAHAHTNWKNNVDTVKFKPFFNYSFYGMEEGE